jgi:hypothetical protein
MTHTVTVPESWLEDVYEQGLAVIDHSLILAAAKAWCDYEGVEAWAVIAMLPQGRKVRPSADVFVVRFGGMTCLATTVEEAFDDIQGRIHRGLGLSWEKRF